MASWGVLIIAGAYLLGLLATGVTEACLFSSVSIAGLGVLFLCGLASTSCPRHWRMGPTRRQWWIAGAIGLVGASYCVAMSPQPSPIDVSRTVERQELWVQGKVLGMPRTSRNNKGQFFLAAQFVRNTDEIGFVKAPRPVNGKLYVSAPLSPSKKLFPGEIVELKGRIERIDLEKNEKRAGFGEYLSQKGCFAMFQARWIEFLPNQEPPRWALWKLRERIVLSQGRWLKAPAGNLLSAMTLGRRAVDLPYSVRDSFIAAGLAHTLAASGFHVALMLTLVLSVMKTRPQKTQALAGFISLAIYVGLTGLQPSVIRASMMGAGVLLGLALERKVKPLGGLLMAATLILIGNPQWIWDVGFQLSVVATLGLIVSVPGLMKRLDWMPTSIAGLVAVPIAAYLWTIPLQLLYFEVLPTYSVLLNAITTPFIIIISTGGFVSAIAAIIFPVLGSMIASALNYPIRLLIWLVEQFNQFPGNSVQITGMKGWSVAIIYAIYAAICFYLWQREQRLLRNTEDTAFAL